MGRCPKKTLAHIRNLGHWQKILQAHVEDITDPQDPDFDENWPQNQLVDLLEQGFFMLDEDLGSDTEDEIDNEECEDESMDKVVTDTDIMHFTQWLAEAQLAAVKAEHIKMAKKPHTSSQSAQKFQGVLQSVWRWLNTLFICYPSHPSPSCTFFFFKPNIFHVLVLI